MGVTEDGVGRAVDKSREIPEVFGKFTERLVRVGLTPESIAKVALGEDEVLDRLIARAIEDKVYCYEQDPYRRRMRR